MRVLDTKNVLMFDIHQPFAHYREPKVMQDDYVPTLNLPPATTIAGMVAYLTDRRLKSKFKIGVVGTYKKKVNDFVRGEVSDFVKGYGRLAKSNYNKLIKEDEDSTLEIKDYYDYYKKNVKNRVMHFETLQNVNLKIFFSCEDNELVRDAFENPSKYISLGRKEDFVIGAKKGELVKQIEIEEVLIENKKDAVRNDLLFKNTYVPVDIKGNKDEEVLNEGILYSLPETYKSFDAEKKDRVIVHGHYVYLNEQGAYLGNRRANVYSFVNDEGEEEKIVFNWLTEEKEVKE